MSLDRERRHDRAASRWNDVFEVLAAEPRRQLVDALVAIEDDGYVSLPAAAESPNRPSNPDEIRVQLRHHHLPRLEDGGYVEWQRDPFRASRGERFEEVEVVLEALYANVSAIPDQLVDDYRPLERQRVEDPDS
ncbi:hypothetical protein [Natronobacterium texcoconense]|uniref:ArsR family transcriptional regulator n=1 Tax=Natronobacterium texcoconense TaxID=1095778 RepID=A0A1H1HV56_NATTX|nr:hypothetical protein [Natronobacterium texcoconense]SDR28936.1 hypothetical protein SAMN04489842_3050 [Natronobacterium texcoconense]